MMQPDSVWTRLTAIVADITGSPAERLQAETALEQIQGWDSFANLQFIGAVDEDFGVTITTQEAMKLRTLGDMERFLRQRLAAAGTPAGDPK